MKPKEENAIVVKSFEFACEMIDLYKKLSELKYYKIADQVCASGTSIGANVREAQRGSSRADFINKLRISLKEAEETKFWFEVIEKKYLS